MVHFTHTFHLDKGSPNKCELFPTLDSDPHKTMYFGRSRPPASHGGLAVLLVVKPPSSDLLPVTAWEGDCFEVSDGTNPNIYLEVSDGNNPNNFVTVRG